MIPSRVAMLRFELAVAMPLSFSALRDALSGAELARALWGYARRSLSDPFAALGPPIDDAERFTRRQLAPVLALDAALRDDAGLSPTRARALLLEVVSRSGAEFLRSKLSLPDAARWATLTDPQRRALAEGMLARFPNATSALTHITADGLRFEVRSCWFAALARRMDQPELAALFCAADARFFGDPAVGVALERPELLATGGACCDFRLRYNRADAEKL